MAFFEHMLGDVIRKSRFLYMSTPSTYLQNMFTKLKNINISD